MKRLTGLATSIAAFFSFAAPVAATSHTPTPTPVITGTLIKCPDQFNALCNLSTGNTGALVGQIINFAFLVAILIALAFLIYGGVKWITSGGDKADVEGARNHVIASVVGLIVVFLSYFIINLVVQFFTGKPLTELEFPPKLK